MRVSTLIGLAAAFGAEVARGVSCSSALKVDDFANWSSHANSLGYWTSDDSSMTSISATKNVLSFTPKNANSYFYETFCQTTTYTSLQFTIKGPAGGSMLIDMQTQSSCSATTYSTQTYTLSGLTGNTQTVTIPLSQFPGTSAGSVTGFVWYGFSTFGTAWQLSAINLGCSGGSSGSSSTPVVKASSSTPASSSSKASSSSSAAPSKTSSSSSAASSKASSSSSVASSKASSSSSATPSKTSSSVSVSTLQTVASSTPTGCSPLLIDDFSSQSRLTFLYYNSLLMPSSDDGTAKSVTVGTPAANRVTIVPVDGSTYFYSQFNCVDAQTNKYTGISLRIKAPKGTTFSVELDYSATCNSNAQTPVVITHTDLGWTFDGTEKLYLIPFAKFPGLNTQKLTTLLFSGFTTTVSFGPMEFYCGSSGEYIAPATVEPSGPTGTVSTPANTAAAGMVIDKFANADSNALGFYHGYDEGMKVTYSGGKMTIVSNDSDYSWYTQLSNTCSDFTKYKGSYLHIAYSGAVKFTVSLQQNNPTCDSTKSPSPQTWDSAEASRYASNGHIYIPMNHFNIDLTKTIGFALKGFYSAEPAVFSLIEIVSSVPSGFSVPVKDQTGNFVFSCTRPNSFAFAVDDGDPKLAQQVLAIARKKQVPLTFFTVGAPLDDKSTNLTNVYNEMKAAGHQIAMHSYTHPKMEGLADYAAIDWEYNNDVAAVKRAFNGFTTKYFRPPFGTEGARMRSRLTKAVGNDAMITEWSVDVEDWLWAESSTPEQQLVAFQRDVNAGGNLVVMHYLYNSTVGYFEQFIDIAQKTGKRLMRVDQCMMDPNAPPLP